MVFPGKQNNLIFKTNFCQYVIDVINFVAISVLNVNILAFCSLYTHTKDNFFYCREIKTKHSVLISFKNDVN